jgi:hypothetical protein
MSEPYLENVAGDFYVERGCCTLCDVPRTIAPNLFTYAGRTDEFDHCYVSKQPTNDTELDSMLEVIRCAELQCIRYCGNDRTIIKRIEAMGEAAVCDVLTSVSTLKSRRTWWRFWR